MLLSAILGNVKIELFEVFFPKLSSDKMTFCNNSHQTWFIYTLTSARPLRGV